MKELSIEEAYDGNYKIYTELINRLEDVKDAIKKKNYGIAMDILCNPYPEYKINTPTELKESDGRKPLFPDNEVRDIWEYLDKFKTLYGHYPNDADEIEVIVREVIKSKAEWNKRDEEILDTIISVFTHRYADDSEDERDISSWEIVRWAEKLKSRKLKSEWKPSNE